MKVEVKVGATITLHDLSQSEIDELVTQLSLLVNDNRATEVTYSLLNAIKDQGF